MEIVRGIVDELRAQPHVQDAEKAVCAYTEEARQRINAACDDLEAWQIVAYSLAFFLAANYVYGVVWGGREPFVTRMKRSFFRTVRSLPVLKDVIAGELDKNLQDMNKALFPKVAGESFVFELPVCGQSEAALLKELRFRAGMGEVDWEAGHISGTVYHGGEEHGRFLNEVNGMFLWSNPLHVDVFPGVRKMEAEVVAMCQRMYNGPATGCGSMTSGGTESILMAMRCYRQLGYERGIDRPEIVAPTSAHAAFDKAADYFGMTLTSVPVDPVTGAADVAAMRRRVSRNTVVMVGSAFSFPHGIIDDIEGIAAVARGYDGRVGVHVDCCLGGFLMPFMDAAGFVVPAFDFRVDGVTSISCDTHKYGFSPKGTSVVLYRDSKIHEKQFFVAPDWPGGIYACPAVAGSRCGSVIAATWASLMRIGHAGYVQSTRKIVQSARKIKACVRATPGVRVIGDPQGSVVAFASDDFDVYRVNEALGHCGWNLNVLQFPASVHICVTLVHTRPGVTEKFCKDFKASVAKVRSAPGKKVSGMGAMYGMSQGIPDRSMVSELAGGFISACLRVDPGGFAKQLQHDAAAPAAAMAARGGAKRNGHDSYGNGNLRRGRSRSRSLAAQENSDDDE